MIKEFVRTEVKLEYGSVVTDLHWRN